MLDIKKNTVASVRVTASILLLVVLATSLWTCKYPEGAVHGNTLPRTRLANVPANDTIAIYIKKNAFPEMELSWLGDDPDGYVIGFQYRWRTTRPDQPWGTPGPWTTILNLTRPEWANIVYVVGKPQSTYSIYHFLATLGQGDTSTARIIGDSLQTGRTFAVPYKTGPILGDSIAGAPRLIIQTPTKGTFIFDSPADSNYQMFEVRSVDNSDGVDPVGANVKFWTTQSPGTIVSFDNPNGFPDTTKSWFVIREITDRWLGLKYSYHAVDANNTFGIQFSWAVDSTYNADSTVSYWSEWTDQPYAYVTAKHFRPIRNGRHVFFVRARNRWGVVSPDSSKPFRAVIPKIDDSSFVRTLIINNDKIGTGAQGSPTLAQVDSFYRGVMNSLGRAGTYDIWDVPRGPNTVAWPTRDTLGYYSSVVILMEQKAPVFGVGSARRFQQATQQADFRQYLAVGGKLIWSGSPAISICVVGYLPLIPGSWGYDIFHVAYSVMGTSLSFNGVTGAEGYPDVPLDPMRVAVDSVGAWDHIGNMSINYPYGFATAISNYVVRPGYQQTPDGAFAGEPVGIRFLPGRAIPPARQTWSCVYFGMPMYYGETNAVIASFRKAFQDINE
jgi:hypothetical protein